MKKAITIIIATLVLLIGAVAFFFYSDTRNPYEGLVEINWGKFSGSCEAVDAPAKNYGKDFKGCDYSVPKDIIPVFEEVGFDFKNEFDNSKSLPLVGSALIDVDGDGVDEVFVRGGYFKEDAIFKYQNGAFTNISTQVNLPKKGEATTLGAVSFDMDKDGHVDLLVTRESGVYFYKNNPETSGGKFSSQKLDIPLNEKSNPATIALADVNEDGHVDLFLCNYIKLEKMEAQTIFNDLNYGANSLLF